ncbi:MAG: hypothetical protein WD990_03890 [Acidimicrobiia bacterium]
MSSARAQTVSEGRECWTIKLERTDDDNLAPLACDDVISNNPNLISCLTETNRFYPNGCDGPWLDGYAEGESEEGSNVYFVRFDPDCDPVEILEACGVWDQSNTNPAQVSGPDVDGYWRFEVDTGGQDLSHLEIAFCCG